MANKTVTIPQDKITKAEEIKVIQDFIAALPKDGYLVDILEGMDAYCTSEIENDFGINPLETINARNENIDTLQKMNAALQKEVAAKDADAKYAIQIADECKQRAEKDAQHARTQYDELTEALKAAIADKQLLLNKLTAAEAKLVELKAYAWDQYQEIEKLERKLAKA